MAIELFGPQIGSYAGIACVVSYLFSGHTGIYRAQRVGQAKHHRSVPEGARLGDLPRPPQCGSSARTRPS